MKKKEYIENAKNAILNRVRFHAPIAYDGVINKKILESNFIDVNKPVFKFEKSLNKHLLKAFELAKKEEKFNLVIPVSNVNNNNLKSLKKLKNCVVFSPQKSPIELVEMLNKLNINYSSASNYNLVFKDKFFKINDQILNPRFDDFQLKSSEIFDQVLCEYKEFVLNGNNFFLVLKNYENVPKKMRIELNIPLEKGYHFFKKQDKYVLVENLLAKKKCYLNYFCKNAKFSFSNVDGLENSVFCCVNVKLTLNLPAKKQEFVYFNFGETKFLPKNLPQVEKLCELSRKKSFEIFNVRVKTKNEKFDQFFNINLPKQIWINWLNNQPDQNKEEKYIALKRLFVKGSREIEFVHFDKIGLKEIGIFNGEYFKKILIVGGQNQFLQVGKTFFHNINGLTKVSLCSGEPISLCFGQ